MNWILLALSMTLMTTAGLSKGRYGQMAFSFNTDREITITEYPSQAALEILFSRTEPSELKNVEYYDETLIKRLIVTDLGTGGAKLKMFLRDRNLKVSISEFNEPYRVTIDIFDQGYSPEVDPSTGLPLVANTDTSSNSAAANTQTGSVTSQGPKSEPYVFTRSAVPSQQPQVTASSSSDSKMKLVAPAPKSSGTKLNKYFKEEVAQIPDGRGLSWQTYPPYIYPLQTAIFQGRANPAGYNRRQQNGMSEGQALAEYALKLFNFGHEKRALAAYLQAQRKDPTVFDQDPLHLWALSEIQFGAGNLTLAKEYYAALKQKHPGSMLAVLADLRLLDSEALLAIEAQTSSKGADFHRLSQRVEQVNPRGSAEIELMMVLRSVYWSKNRTLAKGDIPAITEQEYQEIRGLYPNHEDPKTGFLAATLVVNYLTQAKWTKETNEFSKDYFTKYQGSANELYTKQLRKRLSNKLNSLLKSMAAKGRYIDAIELYESAPSEIKDLNSSPDTAWALGESYRNIGKSSLALPYYEQTAKQSDMGIAKLKGSIWTAIIAGNSINEITEEAKTPKKVDALKQKSKFYDEQSLRIWDKLTNKDKRKFAIAYKDILEENVLSETILKAPPKIVLSQWTESLSTSIDPTTASSGLDQWKTSYSPSASLVKFLPRLAERFNLLGMEKERKQSLALLKKTSPSELGEDNEAKQIWANELTKLADDFRKSNRYLDAGRLYTQVATESQNWERKSEALYKGGLLLYRAGRKDEAIAALREASQDGSNLFYQNLAQERLNQLEQ